MVSMFPSCSACRNRYNKNRPDLHFYAFPFTQPLCKKWCKAMGKKNWHPTISSCLCSEHFVPEDFYSPTPVSNIKRLKPNAVPSKFLSSYPFKKLEETARTRKLILKEKMASHSKPMEIVNSTATLKATDEEIPDIKPDVHGLTIATKCSASDHLVDIKQCDDDKSSCKSDMHETSATDSDTDTASETEEISFSDVIIHSVSSCVDRDNSNSGEFLEQNLKNIESDPKPKEAIDKNFNVESADKLIEDISDVNPDMLTHNVSSAFVSSDEATQLTVDVAACTQYEHQQSGIILKSADKLDEEIPDIKPDIHMLDVRSTVVQEEVTQHKDDVPYCAQNNHQESDGTLKSTDKLNEEILDIKPDIHILNINSTFIPSDEETQHSDSSINYHKLQKHQESNLTSESSDESSEEILDIKPDILILGVNSSIIHSDEETQYKDDTSNCDNNKHQESEASSDTETSSEAEEIMYSEMKLNSDFPSSINQNSEEILKRKLENMIVRYEKTREKMELYREKWKLCVKQVTALEEIIDNLKTNNSINDNS